MLTLDELIARGRPGRVEWIGVRPERRQPMLQLEQVELLTQRGCVGDRFSAKPGRARQVSIVQAEHLPTIAAFLGSDRILPGDLRRNLVVSGINLLSLRVAKFKIGHATLLGTGHCHPCSRLEETLGVGGYNATRGLGGITARVLQGAVVSLGDEVTLLEGRPESGA